MADLSTLAVFILTNGRPDNVRTYRTLRANGYTGAIRLIVDDQDKSAQEYLDNYGDEVVIFDKEAAYRETDSGDNFRDMRGPIYARNASHGIARELGFQHFIQLDDDYTHFAYRFDGRLDYSYATIRNLDQVFAAMLDFFETSGATSLAMAQGGDYMGGPDSPSNPYVHYPLLTRKCMNSFICSVDRPFKFSGILNDDVNTYVSLGSRGALMLSINQVSLQQAQTQQQAGGMTPIYLAFGTYVKSFYSVMYHPSSVTVHPIQSKFSRLHHRIQWRNTTPMILSEDLKR